MLLGLVACDVYGMDSATEGDCPKTVGTQTPTESFMEDPELSEVPAKKQKSETAEESKKRSREEETSLVPDEDPSLAKPSNKTQKSLHEWEKFDLYQFAENCFKNLKSLL